MSIQIKEVKKLQEFEEFIEFTHRLYASNPYWVPRMKKDELAALQRPYSFIDRKLFLAYRGDEVVGRIAGIINNKENEFRGLKQGRFGWFDFIDDSEVSNALIDTVANWVKEEGMSDLKGPFGYTNLDPAGMLTYGYDELATIVDLYNFPYYISHMEQMGFKTHVNWVEYEGVVPNEIPSRVARFADLVKEKYKLKEARLKSNKDIVKYADRFFELLNESYSHLEGFVPLSEEQKQAYIDNYFKYANPDFISIVLDDNDDLIAFGITMPSFSKALQRSKGKMYPFGWNYIQSALKKNDRADLYLIGVRPEYRSKGVPALVMRKIIDTFISYGIRYAETNPEQEENFNVQNLWKDYEFRLHKKRCSFIREL